MSLTLDEAKERLDILDNRIKLMRYKIRGEEPSRKRPSTREGRKEHAEFLRQQMMGRKRRELRFGKDLLALLKQRDIVKRLVYYLDTAHERLPFHPDLSEYHPELVKAINKLPPQERKLVMLCRRCPDLRDAVSEAGIPPSRIWHRRMDVQRHLAKVAGPYYRERWLFPPRKSGS